MRLSSSLTKDPAMLCLLYLSDWMLNKLLESSSPPPKALPFGVFPVKDEYDGALDCGVDGDWRLGCWSLGF